MIPVPKRFSLIKEAFEFPEKGKIFASSHIFNLANLLKETLLKDGKHYSITTYNTEKANIKLLIDPNVIVNSQGYRIKILGSKISLIASSQQGLFYAIQSMRQLIRQYNYRLPSMIIEDEPDFANRGFMLDISRDRIPAIDTLKWLIDILAELKYNQFQLYTEHTFAYENHEQIWKEYSPLTAEEILELDKYCKERFIELVPNQNSFGHLSKWLKYDRYKHLAECPDGFITPWGEKYGPFSLSPAVPESIEFMENLFDELLPNFTSKKINIGGDETFDLGLGRSKQLCEELGKGKVYLNFLLSIYNIVRKHGKTMMFWGDIIKNYPELVDHLPDDVVSLIWGYEKDHPFQDECRLFAEKGVTFYVCPGTSTWNSFTGRINNAIENIQNAITNGKRYNAAGFLLTDWGDNGHHQHLPFSIIGISYAASLGWNISGKPSANDLLKDIDLHILKTDKPVSQYIYSLGNLYKYSSIEVPNASPYFLSLLFPERVSKSKQIFLVKEKEIEKAINDAQEIIEQLSTIKSNHQEKLIDQIINDAKLAILGMKMLLFIKKYSDISNIPDEEWRLFTKEFKETVKEFEKIWNIVNRQGGLKQSVEKLTRIIRARK